MERWLAFAGFVILLVCGACLATSADAPKARGQRVIVILVDVTSSLVPGELEAAKVNVRKVLTSLRAGDQYWIYPIHVDGWRSQALWEGVIPAAGTTQQRERRRRFLIKSIATIEERIDNLYKVVNGSQPPLPEDRSCLLSSIVRVGNQLRQVEKGVERFIFVMSDMVEECSDTPLPRRVSLAREDIGREIELIEGAELDCSLGDANFIAVIPRSDTSLAVDPERRPSGQDLRRFWERALAGCGFSERDLEDPGRFFFDVTLPLEFRGALRK